MVRQSVLYLHRDSASAEDRARMLRGLAYLGTECMSVRCGDYGDDLLGGSERLLVVPPWERTPRFHARNEGPPSNYDVAFHLDFEDETALMAYEADPAREPVERLHATLTVDELTARVVWRYEGDVRSRRGRVRHTAMHVWRDDADAASRARALDVVGSLAERPGIDSVAIGENLGTHPTDFDWIVDLEFSDLDLARRFLESDACTAATDIVAAVTKGEWTARVTHLMRGGA